MKIVVVIICMIALSCNEHHNNEVNKESATVKEDTLKTLEPVQLNDSINIGTLGLHETSVEGCSGLFREKNTSNDTLYVFASDLQSQAFIKIDGKRIVLKKLNAQNREGVIKEEYEGDGCTVLVNATLLKQVGDEVWQYEGNLQVKKDNKEKTVSIIGEVGC
jgi:hypothetical protein